MMKCCRGAMVRLPRNVYADPLGELLHSDTNEMRRYRDGASNAVTEKPGARKAGWPWKASGNNPMMLIFSSSLKISMESILTALNPLMKAVTPTVMVMDGSRDATGERPSKIVHRVLAAIGRGRRRRPRGLNVKNVKSGARSSEVVRGGPPLNVMDGVSDRKRRQRLPQKLRIEPMYGGVDVSSRKRHGNAKQLA